jgi:biotin transport system substrate-specific component
MTHPTYPDLVRPRAVGGSRLYDVALILGGSLLLAAGARISFWLPFSPVPITAQTLAVLLVGSVLGPWRGAAAVTAYLAQGAAGLPVFAAGAGIGYLLGPTGGYLLGFVPAAWLAGYLVAASPNRSHLRMVAAMALADAAIFVPGVLWLATVVGLRNALAAGLLPFLPGELYKIPLAAAGLPVGWELLRRISPRG